MEFGSSEGIVSEEEATKVLNIPLSPIFPDDRLIWQGTKTMLFSVRSVYHLCMDLHKKKKKKKKNPVKSTMLLHPISYS